MALFHILIQSIIQGVTEFLPVSSSAHLLLYSKFVTANEESISLDIAVHLGSLLAVVLVMKNTFIDSFTNRSGTNKNANIKLLVFIATLPIIFVALFLDTFFLIDFSRQLAVIAFANIAFSILLYISDKSEQKKSLSDFTKTEAFIIGVWQSFALFPGASRSGSTITGARFLKYKRKDAILISMLLSVPAIGCSSIYLFLKIFQEIKNFDLTLLFFSSVFSFIFAFLSLKVFLWLGDIISFTPFVVYRLFLGIIIIFFVYF